MTFYGIGVGRLMALIIEDSHDGRGPVWPWLVGSTLFDEKYLIFNYFRARKTDAIETKHDSSRADLTLAVWLLELHFVSFLEPQKKLKDLDL